VQQEEAAAAKAGGIRLDHAERRRDRHRRVERVAAAGSRPAAVAKDGRGDGGGPGGGRDAHDEEQQREERDAGARACAREQGSEDHRQRGDQRGA
jgi:hypothetical protein